MGAEDWGPGRDRESYKTSAGDKGPLVQSPHSADDKTEVQVGAGGGK